MFVLGYAKISTRFAIKMFITRSICVCTPDKTVNIFFINNPFNNIAYN